MKAELKYIAMIVALVTMIVVRCFYENSTIISSVGFLGMIMSIFIIYSEVSNKGKKIEKHKIVNAIAISTISLMTVVLILILTNVITLNCMWNDFVLLLTLLLSLPNKYYIRKIIGWINV